MTRILHERLRLKEPVDKFLLWELERMRQERVVRNNGPVDQEGLMVAYMREVVPRTLEFLTPICNPKGCPQTTIRRLAIDIETEYKLDALGVSCGIVNWKKTVNIALAKRMEAIGWHGD